MSQRVCSSGSRWDDRQESRHQRQWAARRFGPRNHRFRNEPQSVIEGFEFLQFLIIIVYSVCMWSSSDSRHSDRRPVPIEIGWLRSLETAESHCYQTGIVRISPRFPIRSTVQTNRKIYKNSFCSFIISYYFQLNNPL